MEISESEFHRMADAFLESLFSQMDEQDEAGVLDIDYGDGMLTITEDEAFRQFVVSKHSVSRQIWLSSPLSGGLHFSPSKEGKNWCLPDGRCLTVVLSEELSMITGAEFVLETE